MEFGAPLNPEDIDVELLPWPDVSTSPLFEGSLPVPEYYAYCE